MSRKKLIIRKNFRGGGRKFYPPLVSTPLPPATWDAVARFAELAMKAKEIAERERRVLFARVAAPSRRRGNRRRTD